ncbi:MULTISPECIES: chemotaxis protein CheB [Amycolatopsis]|uniref:protein-glutamate methylesterase n=1 Tax=Amycolatopsis bullii TaxID=941987 RepID=A0ABQ3K884_9PSEU|nr:chemotaxis protein CheB [Amycolatopsis bullii]GHG03944.1 hypothetical protein GCM10017567_19890 [Amycolatopsis bullii]
MFTCWFFRVSREPPAEAPTSSLAAVREAACRQDRTPGPHHRHRLPLITPGGTVIPTGYAAALEPDRTVTMIDGDPFRSGDLFLTSLAATLGPAAIAVVLTGMLDDGAQGVRAIKRRGGRVRVQDPKTARAPGMPSSAMPTGCVDLVLPLDRLAACLVDLTMAPGGADLLTVPMPPWAQLHPGTRTSA